MWMLFPKEEEYIEWFEKAGFKDVKLKRIGPKWYRGVRRHGLIMGCSVTGVKRDHGDSPLQVIVSPLIGIIARNFLLASRTTLFHPGYRIPIDHFLQLISRGQRLISPFFIFSLQLGPKAEDVSKPANPITFLFRFLMGMICAAYYVLVPIYMWIKDQIVPKGMPI
jgi:MPBQ/MSBQ methyltransferase